MVGREEKQLLENQLWREDESSNAAADRSSGGRAQHTLNTHSLGFLIP